MSLKYRPAPFMNGVSSFKAAFPMLSDAQIEWRERRGPEDASRSDVRKIGFRKGNFSQGIAPCSNPACHEGGFELDRLITAMLREDQAEREGTLLCAGREVTDGSKRGPLRCPHRIEYAATLAVRNDSTDGPDGRRSGRRPSYRRGRGRGPRRPYAA
jgi:hypothetical protein